MRVNVYNLIQNREKDNQLQLVKERGVNYPNKETLSDQKAIVDMMQAVFQINDQAEEYAYLLCLNQVLKLSGIFEISHGSMSSSIVDVSSVLRRALMCNCTNIILCHNHPSGNTTPSRDDISLTKRLSEASKLIGLSLLDHIIIGDINYFSFAEREMM